MTPSPPVTSNIAVPNDDAEDSLCYHHDLVSTCHIQDRDPTPHYDFIPSPTTTSKTAPLPPRPQTVTSPHPQQQRRKSRHYTRVTKTPCSPSEPQLRDLTPSLTSTSVMTATATAITVPPPAFRPP
ncbi:hypothetical protein H257_11377 [Aphanomyces astaci]|uniref:Uncharacterized protein n=1 Tax=Aphanomyces astaci TaxID=112090 RepID=W4G488_APHAT|nr:hypothetical protein H257_11377 [Aphanomyces astaci]ETV74066.1 hypothetical protein H257_11377 [Aphanomyces astaci]|eukprot:XP_009836579.1 hypothetical protein H257_11377 [Aphanomyces astaci]